MKKFKMFLIWFCLSSMFFAAIDQYATIEGHLIYNYDSNKPIAKAGSTIEYADGSHVKQGSTTTDTNGYYSFEIDKNGTYTP